MCGRDGVKVMVGLSDFKLPNLSLCLSKHCVVISSKWELLQLTIVCFRLSLL